MIKKRGFGRERCDEAIARTTVGFGQNKDSFVFYLSLSLSVFSVPITIAEFCTAVSAGWSVVAL